MGKSAGVDGIVSDILRAASGAIWKSKLDKYNPTIDAITLLFNYVFDNEVWPDRWSQGIIIPLHKQDSPTNPGNYRPITLLSIMQKLFGYIMNQRLMKWSEAHSKLSDAQGGFRWDRSTVDQILILREILQIRKEEKLETIATFIDIRKAYDKIWREANYVRMHDMGINGKAWRQLQQMHNSLRSKIRLPIGDTDWVDFLLGVAQGAVESPWAFNCFINGLAEELTKHNFGVLVRGKRVALLMYADDIVMLAANISEMKHMMRIVSQYAYKFRFKFNGSKSAVMTFNAGQLTQQRMGETTWSLFGEKVTRCHQYKYLGILITTQFWNWRPHITKMLKKARYATAQILHQCRNDKGMQPRPARSYWMATVRPMLEYAAEIWAEEIPRDLVKQAEKIQTDFARGILGLHSADGISNDDVLAELGMEPLEARWHKLRLGYWWRIQQYESYRLIKHLIEIRTEETKRDHSTPGWCSYTKRRLELLDQHEAWDNPASVSATQKEVWKDIVYKAVEHNFNIRRQERRANTQRYLHIKTWAETPRDRCFSQSEQYKLGMYKTEVYLDESAEHIGRKLKTLGRLNALPLMDKIGKQQQWGNPVHSKAKKWDCPLCNEEKENIHHLFLNCKFLERHRNKMMENIELALDTALEPHTHRMVKEREHYFAPPEVKRCPDTDLTPLTSITFRELSQEEKLHILLGKQTGCQTAEKQIDKFVKRFLKKAWRHRGPYVVKTNERYSRCDYIL